MKKLFAMLLVAVMVIGMFAGCAKEDTASVYLLNFKPEADASWQELAAVYTKETGVPVKVITAASGTYSDTLNAEMAKDELPLCSSAVTHRACWTGMSTLWIWPAPASWKSRPLLTST